MTSVTVLGSLNVDFVVTVDEFPRAGQTVSGNDFAVYSGGKGLNQAIASARAGAQVQMCGAVGTDSNAAFLLQILDDEGISRHQVIAQPGPSGSAVIEVEASGENRIVVVPGANAKIAVGDFSLDAPTQGRHVLLGQFEVPLNVLAHYFNQGRASGYFTILNPAPAKQPPVDLLAATDLIVPNESEAEQLTGLDLSRDDIMKVAQAILDLGPQAVIITLGAQGSYYWDGEHSYRVPALSVTPVDTTAAGDTYCGYLAAQISAGASVFEAMRYASIAASLSTLTAGAAPSVPRYEEVSKALD